MFKVYKMEICAICLHFSVKLQQPQILSRETNQSSQGKDHNLDILSVTFFFLNGNGCMIVLEAGEWGRFGWIVNLALGLLGDE